MLWTVVASFNKLKGDKPVYKQRMIIMAEDEPRFRYEWTECLRQIHRYFGGFSVILAGIEAFNSLKFI